MNSLAMNFYLSVKKNPHFSALKFEYFAISFYRALLLKEIIQYKNGHQNPALLKPKKTFISFINIICFR